MKFGKGSILVRAAVASALTVALSATFSFSSPLQASAAPRPKTITRAKVLQRANYWVKRRVPYSQSRHRGGYRQDCSGFVSMAWSIGRSYTTRSLPSVGRRIPTHRVRPGDAVIWPGHAVIFGGWKNRRARTFYAYEEPTWGKVARKRVVAMKSGARVYQRPGIRDVAKKKRRKVAAKPSLPSFKTGLRMLPSESTATASLPLAPNYQQ